MLHLTTLAALWLVLCSGSLAQLDDLAVDTASGTLTGVISSGAPTVRKFLGVPYAKPPTHHLRFAPPHPFAACGPRDAKAIGHSCPQQPVTTRPISVETPSSGNITEFFPPAPYTFSEDCLTLNVWSPTGATGKSLPVVVWFFGGSFTAGGTDARYYDPTSWVARTGKHLVVSVNFRSNIFGFPNSAELHDQNLGILDQRLALEWVRDNIEAFGGDASRIGLWGQSAGAIAVDYLNFAYPSDPIASALYLNSGTALYSPQIAQSSDTGHVQFAAIATAVGCGAAASQLDCMRTKPWQDIEKAVASSNGTFRPVPDDRVVFGDYRAQYASGKLSRLPAIVGTAQHEANAQWHQLISGPFNQTALDHVTNTTFLYSAAATSSLRKIAGRQTYRYRYDGDFPNISPPGYPGAWHASELPLLFGTSGDFHGPNTDLETRTSERMQDLWLAFVEDPASLESAGWPEYGCGQAVLLGDNGALVTTVGIDELDAPFPSLVPSLSKL